MDTDRRLALATLATALAGAAAVLAPTTAEAVYNHHDKMRAAIQAIRDARAEVTSAGIDWGGHRDRALAAMDSAIQELHAALQWADSHGV